MPSLKQLNEAVMAYMAEFPDALITVVVDASFGHRIDSKEVSEFDAAVSNNEIVAPPAGAIGRGDAFVLSIANKVKATILSNDSYQEFHGTYPWLFDEGRLVGGKPVPHIGWVFVNRLPVRGPTSRKSVSEAKRGKATTKVKASAEANQPMPVPAAPPPGATMKPAHKRGEPAKAASAKTDAHKQSHKQTKAEPKAKHDTKASVARDDGAPKTTSANDLLSFLNFVEHHQPGSSVNAIVESYSSHGAYVRLGDVRGYVPLSLMADPAPRSAREFMKIGESVTLVVESFTPGRRSIDLAMPTMATIKPPPVEVPVEAKAKRAPRKAAKAAAKAVAEPAPPAATEAAPTKKRQSKKAAAAAAPAPPDAAPAPRKRQAKKLAAAPATVVTPTPAPASSRRSKKAAVAPQAASDVPPADQPRARAPRRTRKSA
jgi:hypothetical protein